MTKKRMFIVTAAAVLAAAAAILAILLIPGRGRDMQRAECELYFLNDTGTNLVSEKREIRYGESAELPKEAVLQLIKGPEDARNKRVIDKNVKLNSITVAYGNAVVDFSGDYRTDDDTKNALSTYAVVKTLCALDGVDKVKVTADGADMTDGSGTAAEYLTASDINLASDMYTSETREITLYFPHRDSENLYKERRTIKITDQQPVEQYIINELIKGPQSEEMAAALSSDTKLLSVEIYEDICFVNLKSDFTEKNSGNAAKEKLAVYSIVDSLTELKNIKRVQFLMDGKRVDKFGELDIKYPISRNSVIIG